MMSSSSLLRCLCLLYATMVGTTAFRPTPTHSSSSRTTAALYEKTSDRAHIERNLEEMMGNDWREFRAKLVALEKANGGIQTTTGKNEPESSSSSSNGSNHPELKHQGQLSELFGAAISSIFKGHQESKNAAAAKMNPPMNANIFDGDRIAGLEMNSEDPFVSADELPLFLPPVTINKHRWAHEIPHVEPGCVLIANEKLGGVFHQTVVLIVQHSDTTGSIGIVINRPLNGDLLQIASEQEKSNLDLSLKLAFASSPVTYGGPVMSEEYSIIHGFGEVAGSTKLCPGVYVGGSEELMNEVRIHRFDPKHALFVQGHAAWVPGQLSKEISKGVWYTAAVSADFILRYAGAPITTDDNPNDLWYDILNCMGGNFAEVAEKHKGRGDLRMP